MADQMVVTMESFVVAQKVRKKAAKLGFGLVES